MALTERNAVMRVVWALGLACTSRGQRSKPLAPWGAMGCVVCFHDRVHCDCRGLVSVVLKPPKSGSQSQRWRRRSACASVCIHERFVWISFDPTGICAALFRYKAQLPRGGYGCTSVLEFSLVFNFTSEAVLRGPSQRRAPSCASGGGVAATRPRPVPPASLSRPTRPP